VPPWDDELREEPECDALPPRLDAPGEFAIRAARSFDIPFSFSFSYCFSFFTLGRFPGISTSFSLLFSSMNGIRLTTATRCRARATVAGPRVG
jgi:hypothetical protein